MDSANYSEKQLKNKKELFICKNCSDSSNNNICNSYNNREQKIRFTDPYIKK